MHFLIGIVSCSSTLYTRLQMLYVNMNENATNRDYCHSFPLAENSIMNMSRKEIRKREKKQQ
jgi:hypothetical protein